MVTLLTVMFVVYARCSKPFLGSVWEVTRAVTIPSRELDFATLF